MSVSKEKVEEEIKFWENQRDQAKEIFIKAVGAIQGLEKLLGKDKK